MKLIPADDGPSLFGGATRRMAEKFGVEPDRVNEWSRASLIGSADEWEVDLRDATLVRSLCVPTHLKPARIRRALDRLREWLPPTADPPRRVTILLGGPTLLVRLPTGELAEPTGQYRLDFSPHVPPPLGRLGLPTAVTAHDWHERGLLQESSDDVTAAIISYHRSLLIGGPDPQVMFDLANVLARLGHADRAIERYYQVVESRPLWQHAWVNLGDVLLTAGRYDAAIDALRRALDLDPDDAAAHYNLADAFDGAGLRDKAEPHWAAFLRLGGGPLANVEFARGQIGRRVSIG